MTTRSERDIRRFDRWAKTYDRSFLQDLFFAPIQSKLIDLCAAKPEPPRRVLDIGCGTGRLLHAVHLRWPDAALTGVDPAPHMIAEARRRIPDADFKIAAAESLPVADASVDLAMSSMSFHHWADQHKALTEITRVLVFGGRFCLADHTAVFANVLGEQVRSRRHVASMFADAGLRVMEQKGLWLQFATITLGQK